MGLVNDIINVAGKLYEKLHEAQRRLVFGGLATVLPYGSIARLSEATGLSRNTISKAKEEFREITGGVEIVEQEIEFSSVEATNPAKIGRPKCEDKQPLLFEELKQVIRDYLYTDDSGNVYCNLSLREIAKEMENRGFTICYSTIPQKLRSIGVNVTRNKGENKASRTSQESESREQDHSANEAQYADSASNSFKGAYTSADFDCLVDHFFSDVCFGSEIKHLDFDSIVDYFLSQEYFEPVEKYTDFDMQVDRFYSLLYDRLELEAMYDIQQALAYFLSLFLLEKEKIAARRRHGNANKKKKSWTIVRKPGGGRHSVSLKYPLIKAIMLYLLDNCTYGDPQKPLLWKSKSQRKIAAELEGFGIKVSHKTVGRLLDEIKYGRKGNRKKEQVGKKDPFADQQMRIIVEKSEKYQKDGFATISIDCKKKENLGNFANKGDDYCKEAIITKDHDFKDEDTVTAVPYGIYDVTLNEGYVNVGVSHDTPEFAVNSIGKWWDEVGSKHHPNTKGIYITADGGGSNSSKSIRFKLKMQELADRTGLIIVISHFPPGKSKYNKIEHRMFNLITNNWRGHPLVDIETIVNYIKGTQSTRGLKVYASIDPNEYKTGLPSNKKDLRSTNILFDEVLGQWNYTIYQKNKKEEVEDIIKNQWEKIDEAEKEKRKNRKKCPASSKKSKD